MLPCFLIFQVPNERFDNGLMFVAVGDFVVFPLHLLILFLWLYFLCLHYKMSQSLFPLILSGVVIPFVWVPLSFSRVRKLFIISLNTSEYSMPPDFITAPASIPQILRSGLMIVPRVLRIHDHM